MVSAFSSVRLERWFSSMIISFHQLRFLVFEVMSVKFRAINLLCCSKLSQLALRNSCLCRINLCNACVFLGVHTCAWATRRAGCGIPPPHLPNERNKSRWGGTDGRYEPWGQWRLMCEKRCPLSWRIRRQHLMKENVRYVPCRARTRWHGFCSRGHEKLRTRGWGRWAELSVLTPLLISSIASRVRFCPVAHRCSDAKERTSTQFSNAAAVESTAACCYDARKHRLFKDLYCPAFPTKQEALRAYPQAFLL